MLFRVTVFFETGVEIFGDPVSFKVHNVQASNVKTAISRVKNFYSHFDYELTDFIVEDGEVSFSYIDIGIRAVSAITSFLYNTEAAVVVMILSGDIDCVDHDCMIKSTNKSVRYWWDKYKYELQNHDLGHFWNRLDASNKRLLLAAALFKFDIGKAQGIQTNPDEYAIDTKSWIQWVNAHNECRNFTSSGVVTGRYKSDESNIREVDRKL